MIFTEPISDEQLAEDFGLKFRLLAPGKFVFVDNNLNIQEGHYHKGSLFKLSNMKASLVCMTEGPNYLLKRDNMYLSIDNQWGDKSKAQEFTIIEAEDDDWEGEISYPKGLTRHTSSDGIDITEDKRFFITISSCWNSSLREYSFVSEPFRDGMKLKIEVQEGIMYPRTEDGKYFYIDRTFCSQLVLKDSICEDTMFLRRVRPGVFSINTRARGRVYIEWVKASVCIMENEPNACSDILLIANIV